MQTDPVGYADQINMYAYVHNDPLNFTDPSGMESKGPCADSTADACYDFTGNNDSGSDQEEQNNDQESGFLDSTGQRISNLATRGQLSTDAQAAEYDAALQAAIESGQLPEFLRENPAFTGTQGTIEALAGGINIAKTPGVKEFFGPKGPVFGNTFYRGKGNSGVLNHGDVRAGFSFDEKSGRLNFSIRVGTKHFDIFSINPPPK